MDNIIEKSKAVGPFYINAELITSIDTQDYICGFSHLNPTLFKLFTLPTLFTIYCFSILDLLSIINNKSFIDESKAVTSFCTTAECINLNQYSWILLWFSQLNLLR